VNKLANRMVLYRTLCFLLAFIIITACSMPSAEKSIKLTAENSDSTSPLVDSSTGLTSSDDAPKNGPEFKIIPDSELVFSPSTVGFDLYHFVRSTQGYLSQYQEEVQGELLNGADICNRIAREYSVNPRLLLSLLEYLSHWVTLSNPGDDLLYPLGFREADHSGLYRQLSWAANILNRGYYTFRVNGLHQLSLRDGQSVNLGLSLNAGSAAIQYFFAQIMTYPDWEMAVSPLGLYAVFTHLFGEPLAMSIDPLVPPGTHQPDLTLPFRPGDVWNFSAGPHSAWGDSAAWAALDFIPPGGQYGCSQSKAWAVAAADGLVVRSANGMVMLDLDQDGYEQTGWNLLYLHIATQERVPFGSMVHTGDHIGHPSCEGGPSSGTHLHIARRYNGEWIPADQDLPFNLDGWISQGYGKEYDGRLIRNGVVVEAYGYITEESKIAR